MTLYLSKEKCGGFQVQIYPCIWMSAYNRRWTFSADLAQQRSLHGVGLPLLRNAADPGAGAQQAAAGNSQSFDRDIRDRIEVTLSHLLTAASLIQCYAPHDKRIVEVGHGRIVEGNMSVLAESNKSNINRS